MYNTAEKQSKDGTAQAPGEARERGSKTSSSVVQHQARWHEQHKASPSELTEMTVTILPVCKCR